MDSEERLTMVSEESSIGANGQFDWVMQGAWHEVIKAYGRGATIKITKSGDTALHIAVLMAEDDTVINLVNNIPESPPYLSLPNDVGDTPLHMAARIGKLSLCDHMAKKQPQLIEARNDQGETPLFLAVSNGQGEVFNRFLDIWNDRISDTRERVNPIFRRDDGDTILHWAISEEHHDLALKIIERYPQLVNERNQEGFLPLHVLATKRAAFKSGFHIGRMDDYFYERLTVEDLNKEPSDCHSTNNTTYVDIFKNQWSSLTLFSCRKASVTPDRKKRGNQVDEERPIENISSPGFTADERSDKPSPYPPNYTTCVKIFSLLSTLLFGRQKGQLVTSIYNRLVLFLITILKCLLTILGYRTWKLKCLRDQKKRHTRNCQIMNKLIKIDTFYKEYKNDGRRPDFSDPAFEKLKAVYWMRELKREKEKSEKNYGKENGSKKNKGQTPLLIAAKVGVLEMVDEILKNFPVAIEDLDSDGKNVVLLAMENRHPTVFALLKERYRAKRYYWRTILRHLDNEENNALHLAAKCGRYHLWKTPGAALQMHCEYKWFKWVKDSMEEHFFEGMNKSDLTAAEIFKKTHETLCEEGGQWLIKTSESCSVVAALVATVAFETSSTVPGGLSGENGKPIFAERPAFKVFAITSLAALCSSVTALVFFLSILTSRFRDKDFQQSLTRRLLMGLTSLFSSIFLMLISFCFGHVFVIGNEPPYATYTLYTFTCLPVGYFALMQLPLYLDLLLTQVETFPQRSTEVSLIEEVQWEDTVQSQSLAKLQKILEAITSDSKKRFGKKKETKLVDEIRKIRIAVTKKTEDSFPRRTVDSSESETEDEIRLRAARLRRRFHRFF